jgi:hypothetical protein
MMTRRIQSIFRLSIATMSLAVVAIGLATAPSAGAAGLRNCVDVSGPQSGRVGCYEDVWAGGSQVRMTFSNTQFGGAAPKDLDAFYVIAPQTATPQGAPPATFPHDHVVRDVPSQSHGAYSVTLQGFFVLCSGQGIGSGACVPDWTSIPGAGTLPFARTVGGQALTSVEPIEAAAAAGDIALVNLGPDAVIVGAVTMGD